MNEVVKNWIGLLKIVRELLQIVKVVKNCESELHGTRPDDDTESG
jgi:hypothetical protein